MVVDLSLKVSAIFSTSSEWEVVVAEDQASNRRNRLNPLSNKLKFFLRTFTTEKLSKSTLKGAESVQNAMVLEAAMLLQFRPVPLVKEKV